MGLGLLKKKPTSPLSKVCSNFHFNPLCAGKHESEWCKLCGTGLIMVHEFNGSILHLAWEMESDISIYNAQHSWPQKQGRCLHKRIKWNLPRCKVTGTHSSKPPLPTYRHTYILKTITIFYESLKYSSDISMKNTWNNLMGAYIHSKLQGRKHTNPKSIKRFYWWGIIYFQSKIRNEVWQILSTEYIYWQMKFKMSQWNEARGWYMPWKINKQKYSMQQNNFSAEMWFFFD